MRDTRSGQEKMEDRIGKLLRQAEGAPEGSPEREAFKERAYVLSQAHSIDMSLARAKTLDREKVQEPEEREYEVGMRATRNNPKARNEHFVDLLLAIAHAYDMRALIAHSRMYVWLMGYPTDHDMVGKMYSMLSVQMVQEADAALARGENKAVREVPLTVREEIPWESRNWSGWDVKRQRWYCDSYDAEASIEDKENGGDGKIYSYNKEDYVTPHFPPRYRDVLILNKNTGEPITEPKLVSTVDGRIWRMNFYKGFTSMVSRRMREARETAMKDAGIEYERSDERGLVLLNKAEEIADRYDQQMLVRASKRGKGFGGADLSQHSSRAHSAGQDAAKKATYGDERVVD